MANDNFEKRVGTGVLDVLKYGPARAVVEFVIRFCMENKLVVLLVMVAVMAWA
ncbi:MAG: hypothetical protein IH991_16090, partial [Planctomycetes bacterium]|nr:hypothetical protein [Planctomycetota bacterium]